jgi:CBS domain-containing protein
MSTGRICTRVVVTATAEESVAQAARRMAEHDVGTLAVLAQDQRVLGIVTDRDIVLYCVARGQDAEKVQVKEVMSGPPLLVRESTPIESALQQMAASRVRRLLVVDAADRLVGLLSLDDVLELLAEEASAIGRLLGGSRPGS